MKKEDLLRYTGSIQQVAYARRIVYDEGRARGLNAVEVKNGPMRFVIMLDKCLDIAELSYKGENINFLSKPGLNGRNPFDTHGGEAQRSIMGGLVFTCGFESIGRPYQSERGDFPMHGRMRTSPAENVAVNAGWEGDEYVITVSGNIREAALFGENLVLHRTIRTVLGHADIEIIDKVSNEAFREETCCLMYHCNIGYPYLNENCRLILPTKKVTARDPVSTANIDRVMTMDAPKDNEEEYVYLHKLAYAENGDTFAALVDDTKARGIKISFNVNSLPEFGQWKSTGSGDYVMGLEPGNLQVYGGWYAEEQHCLPTIGAQETKTYNLTFTVLDSSEEIAETDEICKKLLL